MYSFVCFLKMFRWRYRTSSELSGSSSSGLISRYGGGGFVQDLTANNEDATAQLAELMGKLWLDRGTRVVFLDFTVYNANINLFCQIKLTVEFPASGGAVPSKSFSTVKLIRVSIRRRSKSWTISMNWTILIFQYVSTMDYFVLACEVLFVLFTVYYTIEEVIEASLFCLFDQFRFF